MNQTVGYIYVRNHPSYEINSAYKIGKTNNIPDRDSQYATGEIKRGEFEAVYEVPIEITGVVERLLQKSFCDLNIKHDAGTEFYDKKIITLIDPYLAALGIKYRRLQKQEIRDLIRPTTNTQVLNKQAVLLYTPRKDQAIIIGKSVIHFQQNDRGILVLTCGIGKTLISLWVTQELDVNTIIIGVPNKLLLKQWENITRILFNGVPCLIVSGGIDVRDIVAFFKNNPKKCIAITTYASAHKVYTATHNIKFTFGVKILDEAHHLTTNNMEQSHTTKKYVQMLNIPSTKQLSLTATLKHLENVDIDNNDNKNIVSNNSIEYFGEIIDKKCMLWAINENIICDYVIQTIVANDGQLEQQLSKFHITGENDKRMFLSAFVSLKSINDGHSHHLLTYSNNRDNSMKLIDYIKMLTDPSDCYFDIPNLHYSYYHGDMKSKDQKEILNNFEKAKFGIITCVYCLGEGYDNPNIDAVVFAENMSSDIRIVQSALRASRKNKNQPNKITKIILPIVNKHDWLENNSPDFKKVREVIYQIGLEDETIIQKIKVFCINIEVNKKQMNKIKRNALYLTNDIGEYDEELTGKLRLKTIKRTTLGTGYEKARKIIASKNIKSKKEYFELCEKDSRLTVEPEITYVGQFSNWIEYLSIKRIYYDFQTCTKKINELLRSHSEIKRDNLDLFTVCKELCKLDNNFPPRDLWTDYYGVKNLGEIISFVGKRRKPGGVII